MLAALAPPGWTREGASRGFGADNLWEYIDGDADRFVDAGLSEMRTATYRFEDRLEVVVDVYRMTEASGARQIFRGESHSGWEDADLGDEARQSDLTLVFRTGTDFVRLVAYDMTPETRATLLALGRSLVERLRAQQQAQRDAAPQEVEP